MTTLTGHLTAIEKKAIKAILSLNLLTGRVGKKDYHLSLLEGIYTVKIYQYDRGLIPCPGSKLRLSTYIHTFKL